VKLGFDVGHLDTNHHGTQQKGEPWNKETVRSRIRICKLETFRRLSTGTEAIQSLVGRRLWIYAPSGRCWNFDIYIAPTIKECEPRGKRVCTHPWHNPNSYVRRGFDTNPAPWRKPKRGWMGARNQFDLGDD
jgi:hypothetical protein